MTHDAPEKTRNLFRRLGEVAPLQTGFAFKSEWYVEDGVRLLRNANVHQGFLAWDDMVSVDPALLSRFAAFCLDQGDIVLTLDRPIVANGLKVARLDGIDLPVLLNQRVGRFRPDPDQLDADYLYAFLRSPAFVQAISGHDQSLGVPHISPAQVERVEIPVPPLDHQRRIASAVAEQLVVAAVAERAAEERLAATEALNAAYLRQVFDAPETQTWPRLPIAALGNHSVGDVVQTGPFGAQLPSSEFRPQGIPVLNIGNVKDGCLNLDRLDHVSPEKAEDLARYRVRPGDMLFTRSGSVGRSAVVDATCDGWLISYHLLRVSFDLNRIEPGFISAAIQGDSAVLAQVRTAAGRGATRDGINASILANLVVPTPPLDTQRAVLGNIDRRFDETRKLKSMCEAELATLSALPAALLRAAFNGEA